MKPIKKQFSLYSRLYLPKKLFVSHNKNENKNRSNSDEKI